MKGDIHIADLIVELERDNLLPAIVFRTARSQCDTDAQRAGNNRRVQLSPVAQREMKVAINDYIARYDVARELIVNHPHYNSLIYSGVGAHHAGQLLVWRLLLEELMAAGFLRVLVATGTVAAGVDFPARSVIITAHSKRGADGFANLSSAEFQQMSGRAGRRGKDTVGFCIATPTRFCDARDIAKISKQPPEPLRSAYFPSPSTVLNLLRYRNVDDLRFTVGRSLASFNDKKDAEQMLLEAKELESELKLGNASSTDQSETNLEEEGSSEETHEDLENTADSSRINRRKKQKKKVTRLRRRAEELEVRQLSLLNSALDGLMRLGFIEKDSLSTKGFWAANLCTSIVLELAEVIDNGLVSNVSTEYLVAIVAAISGDEHRRYLTIKNNFLSKSDLKNISEVVTPIAMQQIPGVMEKCPVLQSAADTVLTWMHAHDWNEFRGLLLLSGVAEGDAARLISQTAEQLNQIARLIQSHPELAKQAEEARMMLMRPPLTEVMEIL